MTAFSSDISQKIADLHKIKAGINAHVKKLQSELYELQPGDPQRKVKVKIINLYNAESAVINERLKEYSVMYRNCVDQIVLSLLKNEHRELYEVLSQRAKVVSQNRK